MDSTYKYPRKCGCVEEWDQVAHAWEKYDGNLSVGMASINRLLIKKAGIRNGHRVVDIGSGTGYPALDAALCVGKAGSVIGLDFSNRMLDVARRKAKMMGVLNAKFHTYDVCLEKLPFEECDFDCATSRFCLMLLPEPDMVLKEVQRVLKPHGKFAAAVWSGREKNPYMSIATKVLKDYVEMPADDNSQPGVFSMGDPGVLAGKMEAAGFCDIEINEVETERTFSSGREAVDCIREMAAPLKSSFAQVPEEKRREVNRKMMDEAEKFRNGDCLRIPGAVLVVSGSRSR